MVQGAVHGGLSGSSRWCGWSRGTLTLGLCVALAAGCTAGSGTPAEPTFAPTTTAPQPTAEPTPEPGVATPVEPEAPSPLLSSTPNERDAEKAAEYFLELYEYVLETGDLETWDFRGYVDCGFCSSISEDVSSLTADGAKHHGIAYDVGYSQVVEFDDVLRSFVVELRYSSTAGEVVSPDGSQVRAFEANEEGYLLLEVGFDPHMGWRLFRGARQESSVL